MTTIKLYTVNCDAEWADKALDCSGWVGNEDTLREAREAARRAGWTVVTVPQRQDLCPACTRERERDLRVAGAVSVRADPPNG